jgi:hypothetical protein
MGSCRRENIKKDRGEGVGLKIDVSIVIVNWNTRDILADCLRSVYEQASELSFEIIVVDNASSDGSQEMVTSQFGEVTLIKNTENAGFASANNQGMRIAAGRYVLLLNSDTVVLDGAIEKVVAFADNVPDAAVVGCRVLNPDKTLQPTCFMYPSLLNMVLSCSYLYKLMPQSKFFGRERMTWWDREDSRQVDVVTGCFMLIRKIAIDRVGMMDERFLMYAEETDYCYRFKNSGWGIYFTPSSEIIHLGGQSSRRVRKEMLSEVVVSILKFMKKHYGRMRYWAACVVFVMYFMVRMPVLACMAAIGQDSRGESWCKVRAYMTGIGRILTGI